MGLVLSVIIVTYNSEKYISNCLNSLIRASKEIPHEIFVIDNNSNDQTINIINGFNDVASLIVNGQNLGFAKAVNIGLKRCLGKFIILLNPDVIIKSGSLESVIDFMEINDRVGICGCRLLNGDDSIQYSKGPFPTLFSTILRRALPRRMRKYHLRGYDKIVECDWVTGAFMLIRKKMAQEIDFFDETFFLYYEDVDLCLRAKQREWKILYYPMICAYHLDPHHAKNKSKINKNMKIEIRNSLLKYFKKHAPAYAYQIVRLLFSFIYFEGNPFHKENGL
jgi:GT2 family glycosyltransferase